MASYLDHNATTPLDERVLEAMLPYLKGEFGNPSSVHAFGRRARAALDTAREQVAALIGAHPSQVVFTSGGTEANNTALKGLFSGPGESAGRVVGAIEHASLLAPAAALARGGVKVQHLAVDDSGRFQMERLDELLKERPRLVSLMWANNETGVVQPMAEIAERCAEAGVLLHSDAVQAAGKLELDFLNAGPRMLSLSAHKLFGPKGAGALVLDKAVGLEPLLHGGGQERDWRGGTEALPAIVGFGKAAELALAEGRERLERVSALQERLQARLKAQLPQAVIFGEGAERLYNTLFFAVPGVESQTLIMALDREGYAVSSGAACGSHHEQPSTVLAAMGVAPELARCAVRVGLGHGNSEAEVDGFIAALKGQVDGLQRFATVGW